MTYTTQIERYGRTESVVDLPRFAADLARELGGQVEPEGEYPNERQRVTVGADRLFVSANNYSAKARVAVSVDAADVGHGERNTYARDHKTESATVDPNGRPIARIAADIKRRVLEASAPALARQREYAAQQRAARSDLESAVESLARAVPAVCVNVADDKLSASLYIAEPYFSGRMSADGRITAERMAPLSADKLARLLELLAA